MNETDKQEAESIDIFNDTSPLTSADRIKMQALIPNSNKAEERTNKHKKRTVSDEEEGSNKTSQADQLVELCEAEKVELFHDQHKTAFAHLSLPCDIAVNCDKNDVCSILTVAPTHTDKNENGENVKGCVNNSSEAVKKLQIPIIPQTTAISQYKNVTYQLNSGHFKSWLALLMWKQKQKTPSNDALSCALNVLKGKALLEGKEHELFNRVAPATDGLFIDMADELGRAIKVTTEGWSIVDNPPIVFKRYSHQKALVIPLRISESEATQKASKFLEYINISPADKDTRLALLITVISYFIPLIAHPAIVAHGPQGTAKSYMFKLIRRIVDPSSLELASLTRDEKELTQSLDHNWCCFFDNISYLSGESSDALCRAITGGGNSKRELWTNDDDIIYNFKRCIGLNGINITAQRGDLLDRSLLVGLVKILDRKTDEQLDSDFNKDLPSILGAFLTILSKALKIYPTIQPKYYFRLADWTRYACAIAEALGKTQEDFMNAYAGKVQLQNEETINASTLAMVLLDYCKNEIKNPKPLPSIWEGTATELLQKLTEHAKNLGCDTRKKEMPSAANALSRALNRVSDALQSVGCIVTIKEGTPRRVIINAENVKIEPFVCCFCKKSIVDNNWMRAHLNENKPAHIDCNKDHTAKVTKEWNEVTGEE